MLFAVTVSRRRLAGGQAPQAGAEHGSVELLGEIGVQDAHLIGRPPVRVFGGEQSEGHEETPCANDLTLPLDCGASWWHWLGGRPAFDFVNTLRERWWRNVETLVTPTDLGAWLGEARLIDAPASATDGQLRAARRLRKAIDAGILASTQDAPTPSPTIAEINRWLARGLPIQQLVDHDGVTMLSPRPPRDPIDHALHLVAQDAAAVLGASERSRARVCASDACSARFYDASRAGTRRWCSMNACGNVAKARRHRARAASDE